MNDLNNQYPKVSIGIPTYNRSDGLMRTLNSVFNQTYQNLEIIISDNASTDDTQKMCQACCAADKRIKYIRQPYNRGATANFAEVLSHATGNYFMWLGDDDWIDKAYIDQCLKILRERPEYSLACGIAKYYINRKLSHRGEKLNLRQDRSYLRVLLYYAKLSGNGAFYGLMKKAELDRFSLQNVMGSDWLIIAAIAFLGKFKTLESVSIHRSLGGSTASFEKMALRLGLTRFEKCYPRLAIACHASKDIYIHNPIYANLAKVKRYSFGSAVFALIFIWRAAIPAVVRPVRIGLRKLNTRRFTTLS
jgi:glycosyltransferase involved in cell wall biosynthesis